MFSTEVCLLTAEGNAAPGIWIDGRINTNIFAYDINEKVGNIVDSINGETCR
jgi:hypothetical protein